jgi:iron complex outermembrane receptor protein
MQGNYGYQTKVYFDPSDVTYQPAYGVLNLRASWTDPSGRWEYSVFGNNVTDQAYITQVLPVAIAFNQSWAAPAVVGGEVRFKY